MKMVREFEEQAESKGYQSLTKEAGKYAEEYGLQLQLKHPDPVCVTEEGEVVPGDKDSPKKTSRIKNGGGS